MSNIKSFMFHKAVNEYKQFKLNALTKGFYTPKLKSGLESTDENGIRIYNMITDLEQVFSKAGKKYV